MMQNRALPSPRIWDLPFARGSKLLPAQRVLLEWAGVDDYQSILDASCQNSCLLAHFSQHYQIRACGISDNLDNVRQSAAELDTRTEILCTSKADVPFRNESFDRIFISEIQKSQRETDLFFLELKRTLKAGGHLLISVACLPVLTKLGVRTPTCAQAPFLDNPWGLMERLHSLGFSDISMRASWGSFAVIKASKVQGSLLQTHHDS